ncbi:hypothetical protein [Necropsobacter massiliensis]|uniref:hypothetical protein n=1 Tax=Necropsobacter massiliensis TaxID=1400001 RepID=UPI000660EEB6|nr:hypothetical protein [Necropsobacter massiliensis]
MAARYIAHLRRTDGAIQSVETHLTETAAIAQVLAKKLNLAPAGELLGLMHDFGKYSHVLILSWRNKCPT